MDSGNSGSIQSSSGGDDDYDSRVADSSSFSNPSSTTNNNINPILFSQSSTLFDPLSNYLNSPISSQPQTHNSNSILNLDMAVSWSKSQPNSSDHNPFYTTQTLMSFPQVSQTIATTTGNNNNNLVQQQQDNQSSQSQVGARNPKKRSRASRRAPTTVLTTDTSNFRTMVQEFTGIPAPPFTSSSVPFPRTRLDLFTSPTPSSFRSQPSNFHHNQHLLRPLPQKIQPFTTTNNINNIVSAGTSASPFELSLLKPHQNTSSGSNNNNLLNNMQMQNLTFGSFLQPASSNDPFGLTSHTQVNTNMNIPSTHLPNDFVSSSPRNHEADGSDYNFTQNGKAVADNVSASGSTTRGTEGLMESWICSSD